MSELNDAAIRRYLLGLLPETEAEAVEEAYFGQPEVFDRVRGVEDDLIDDYVAGRLDGGDAAAFEGRYLASEPRRQRVEAARALRLARPPAASAPVTRRVRWLGPLAIAAALAVVVSVVLLTRSRGAQPSSAPSSMARGETPLPSPTLEMASPTPSASVLVAAPGRTVLLALSPTLLRGEGGAAEVRIPPRTDFLVLHLQLQPSEVQGVTNLQADVETVEGARVWSGAAQQVSERENLAAEVAVPVARLPPGDYLVGLNAGRETLHRYFFRIPAR
jgi:hypothetical protein